MSDKRSLPAEIWHSEPGDEVSFKARDVARCKFVTAVNERRRKNPNNCHDARVARRRANAADPLRQQQVPKKDRPVCGSRVDGWNKPCRAHVMPYRDETGAPKLRTLCWKHWDAQQALEAERRARHEAEKVRRGCSCPRSGDLHLYGCPKWEPSPTDPNCAACRNGFCNVHGPKGW